MYRKIKTLIIDGNTASWREKGVKLLDLCDNDTSADFTFIKKINVLKISSF